MKIKLNPNKTKEEIRAIQQKVKDNDGYCPCLLYKDETTKCMCEHFRNTKECICELYIAE